MTQKKIKAAVYSQVQLAEGIFSMWLGAGEMAKAAVLGQFIAVYPNDSARLLPRPISICETDPEKELLRIVYRVAGEGTKELSSCRAGDTLSIMGPLGNGFPLKDKKALLIGGGIGIPPMLELAKALSCEKTAVLGYRDSQTFLAEEIGKYAGLAVATEDGSVGTKGTVLDAIKAQGLKADIIYAGRRRCSGPLRSTRRRRASSAGSPWRSGWPAASARALAASATARTWTSTAMSAISGSVRTVRSFWRMKWSCYPPRSRESGSRAAVCAVRPERRIKHEHEGNPCRSYA